MSDCENFTLTVRGVDRAALGFAEPGESLALKREPENPVDKNAIMVLRTGRSLSQDRALLGYVAQEQTSLLSEWGDEELEAALVSIEFPLNPVEQQVRVQKLHK